MFYSIGTRYKALFGAILIACSAQEAVAMGAFIREHRVACGLVGAFCVASGLWFITQTYNKKVENVERNIYKGISAKTHPTQLKSDTVGYEQLCYMLNERCGEDFFISAFDANKEKLTTLQKAHLVHLAYQENQECKMRALIKNIDESCINEIMTIALDHVVRNENNRLGMLAAINNQTVWFLSDFFMLDNNIRVSNEVLAKFVPKIKDKRVLELLFTHSHDESIEIFLNSNFDIHNFDIHSMTRYRNVVCERVSHTMNEFLGVKVPNIIQEITDYL